MVLLLLPWKSSTLFHSLVLVLLCSTGHCFTEPFFHHSHSSNLLLCQIWWLLKLSQISGVPEVPSFSQEAVDFLLNLVDKFSEDDAMEVKQIEKVTNHDVKAVEYFLKQRCQSHPEVSKVNKLIFVVIHDFELSN